MAPNKRRLRKTFICCALIAVLLAFLAEFPIELFALTWHVRHGRTAEMKSYTGSKYQVRVPILWWPQLHERGWDITVTKKAGPIRSMLGYREWAQMSISTVPTHATATEIRKGASSFDGKIGFTTTEVGSIVLAGNQLQCFERKWSHNEIAQLTKELNAAEVECAPVSDRRALSASFFGDRVLLPQFYEFLRAVTPAQDASAESD